MRVLLAAMLPLALAFIMLWWVPPLQGQLALAVYYAVAYILFDTFFTLLTVAVFSIMGLTGFILPSFTPVQVLFVLASAALTAFVIDFPKYWLFRRFGL